LSESSERWTRSSRSNPRHYEAAGPRGLLRRKPDGSGPRRRWPIAVLIAVGLVASGWWMTNSPLFAARHVEISGQSHLSRADVLRLAGVGPGSNLFWFHAGNAEARLERAPWIAQAYVSRSLPSTLRIVVRERRPVAQVKQDTGYLVVATDGTILARSPVSRGLPLLTFDPAEELSMRREPAWVVGAMSPWLRSRVAAVARTSDGSIVVHLSQGVPAYFGDAVQVQRKDQALAAVLRWAIAGHHPLESINLQAPLAPTARLNVYVPPVTVPVSIDQTPRPKPSPSATPTPKRSPSPGPSPSPRVKTTTHRNKAKHRA
jgi:cell division protein FtsQ